MPSRQVALDTAAPDEVRAALTRLREELGIESGFPPGAVAEAEAAPTGPEPHADATRLPFVTIDPPGSKDLDQALHIERDGDGHLVRYAIASLATFVPPGGALDAVVHERGVTVYGPTGSYPLHPPVLGADRASLLPGQTRPACLWHLRLDGEGRLTDARVERAFVRSRAQLTYAQVQAAVDGAAQPDAPDDLPALLREVGERRIERERERGGVSLDIPEQVVDREDGGFALHHRATLPVEGWNAQVSLLTGMAAAAMMREAGVGILRTLPSADPRDVARLRRTARALGIDWPEGVTYAELLRTLDSDVPAHAAFLAEATTLFRGAGYLPLGVETDEAAGGGGAGDGGQGDGRRADGPPNTRHAAIAAEYAHVTAPLRRLVDRYGLEVCLAHCSGAGVPDWVLAALPRLPATMARTTRVASSYERGAVDALEALVLAGREGEVFDGVVVDLRGESSGTVVLREPAVRGRIEGEDLPVGELVRVRLEEVDVPGRKVRFTTA